MLEGRGFNARLADSVLRTQGHFSHGGPFPRYLVRLLLLLLTHIYYCVIVRMLCSRTKVNAVPVMVGIQFGVDLRFSA